jgi:protein-S-isoprenylcysteine O-methyltransferase Ste14
MMLPSPLIDVNLHPGIITYNVIQLIMICTMYKGEIESPMPYSKFAPTSASSKGKKLEGMVSSKIGMLIIYVPATIAAFVFQFLYLSTPSAAGWLVLLHFLKRDLEVLLLHKYSGETVLNVAQIIGTSYFITATMLCIASNTEISILDSKLGMSLFGIGSLGNLYHHYLLTLLRGDGKTNTKKYQAPKHGLFEYVASPHYFFELLAWLGIAIVSQQLTAYLNLVSMTLYLCARSYKSNEWNRKKFDEKEWPSSRKNLIPFLY